MNGEIIAGVPAEKVQSFVKHKQAVTQANAVPLPGPLADAFAPCHDIKINGKYTVRPVYDIDFEFLQALDHPLHKMIHGQEDYGNNVADFRGLKAWQICFLFTRQIEESETLLSSGIEEFNKAARSEFGKLQLAALISIIKAVFDQLKVYWSPVIGYESSDEENGSKKN